LISGGMNIMAGIRGSLWSEIQPCIP
jgi:hypothetical protein